MKKLFGYLSLPVLMICTQACNNNSSTEKSVATDTTAIANTNTDTSINPNAEENTDTSKTATRIDASQVPGAVVTAFNNKYPNITNIRWQKGDKRGKVFYRAHWQENGKKMMAMFAEDGSFIKEKQPG